MPPAREILLVTIVLAMASGARATDRKLLGSLLDTAYKGKVEMLKTFYSGKRLHFSADGKLIDGGKPGPWTLDAFVRVDKVKLKRGELEMSCHRIEFAYDEKQKKLAPGQGPPVGIDIDSDAETADLSGLQKSMLQVFPSGKVNLADYVPDYWRFYLRHEDSRQRSPARPELMSKSREGPEVLTPDGRNGVTAPRIGRRSEPAYTEEALRTGLSGTAVFLLVVGADGAVKRIEILRPLGLGLDDSAVRTIRTWKFEPATRNGNPVPVEVSVEVTFRRHVP